MKNIAVAIGIVFVTLLLAVVRSFAEQYFWSPQDEAHLNVISAQWSEQGIVLAVEAPSGIDSVWRQRVNFIPVFRQHRRVAFETVLENGETKLLVDYPFIPGSEWLLALKSNDGYWVSMSPYSPQNPEISSREWQRLHSVAKRQFNAG